MKTNKNAFLAKFVIFALSSLPIPQVIADDYHYNNMLIGDRASGMGGAYTAISDDPAGLFYNPAGIVYAGSRNLSASVNAYHTSTTTYKDVLGGGDWTRESSTLIPNFFGVVQPFGKGMLGFSYAVTDAILENQDERLTNIGAISEYILNVNNEDNTYKLGPSYAQKITDNLSIGATLYFNFRSSETIVNQTITRDDSSYEWTSRYLQTEEFGIDPVIGVMWSLAEKLSFGMTLRKTLLFNSDTDWQAICASDIPDTDCYTAPPAPPTTDLRTSDNKRKYPLIVSLGAAYFPSNRLLYSADFVYYGEATGDASENSDELFRTKVATWDFKIGVEYYLSSRWALRGGLFSNHANTPKLNSALTNQPEHIDIYGLSLSASRFTRNSSITLGLSSSFGSGEAQAVSETAQIQDVDSQTLTVFLSTSYAY